MTHKAFRYDVVKMTGPRKDHRGYLVADAVLARTGIQEYVMADGTVRRELRPEKEVLHPDSVDTIKGSVVVNNHPPMALDATNTKAYATGFLKGDPKDGPVVNGCKTIMDELTVFDAKTVDDVLNRGKNQISQGYFCDIDMTSGVDPVFGAYDAIQRNIKHNHTAIVDEGRAGPKVGIKMDSEGQDAEYGITYILDGDGDEDEEGDDESIEEDNDEEIDIDKKEKSADAVSKTPLPEKKSKAKEKLKSKKEGKINKLKPSEQKKDYAKKEVVPELKSQGESFMIIFNIDGVQFQLDEKYADLVSRVAKNRDASDKEISTLKADNAQLSKNLEDVKGENEKLKAFVSDEKAMEQKVEERVQVKAVAREMFPEETTIDSFSTLELQKMIVKKAQPELDVEKRDASFIQGMAAGILSSFKTDGTKKLEGEFANLKKEDEKPGFQMDKAQKSLHNFVANAWRQPDPEKHDKGYTVAK